MASFGLVKSFDIDNGELDALSAQECFVLGYELAQIDNQLQSAEAFDRLVHAKNRERIGKACVDAKRRYAINWMENDPSESWMTLSVKERSSS